jgi:hypothetical protein
MVKVVQFVADIAVWIYLILAILGLILLRVIQVAVRERSQSIFDLERDQATGRINRHLFYLLVVFLVAGGVFYTSNELIEEVPLPEETPTPTAIVQLPPTPTPPPLLPTPTPTLTPTPRPTQSGGELPTLPTATPLPTPQQGALPRCSLPGAHITSPGDGAVVSGQMMVIGRANIEDFDYYKIEFRVPGHDQWSFIESYSTPTEEGLIASWNTATVPPGFYDFRLVVVDKTGNFPEPCQISVKVER